MAVDHVGVVFLPEHGWMRYVGRLAFPLFVFLVAYNIEVRQVDFRRYVMPLLVFGLLSQPIYLHVLYGWEVVQLNILFTLLLGVLYWPIVRSFHHPWLGHAVAAVVLGVLGLTVSYSFVGVFLMPAFMAALRGSVVAQALVPLLIAGANWWSIRWGVFALFALLAIGLARWLSLQVPRGPRWFFYAFYPGHLAVLGVAKALLT